MSSDRNAPDGGDSVSENHPLFIPYFVKLERAYDNFVRAIECGEMIRHPMFPKVLCKVARMIPRIRFREHMLVTLEIVGFYEPV